MYKLDLNRDLTDLDGKPIENGNMSKILANALAMAQESENALKFYGIALDLNRDGYRMLDKADLQKLKEFIKSQKGFPVLTRAQLEEAIEKAEKEHDGKEKELAAQAA